MKILCVGDAMIPADFFRSACAAFEALRPEISTVRWLGSDKAELQHERIKVEKGGPAAVPVPENVRALASGAEWLLVHYCPISEELISAVPSLRLIGVTRGGVENVDVAAATARGIPVLRIRGRNAEAVSDFAIGLMLAEMRNIARAHWSLKSGQWRKDFANSFFLPEFKGKTVGLVGLGKIGSLVARKLQGFQVTVQGFDPFMAPAEFERLGVRMTGLDTVMATSDIISLHARLSPETKGMIGAVQIARMKPTTIFVNTARAGLVDEQALALALRERRIGGAALDVFAQEPLPPGHPFFALDNVTLTSHLAGTTVEALTRSPALLCDSISAFLATGSSPDLVNPAVLSHRVAHVHS